MCTAVFQNFAAVHVTENSSRLPVWMELEFYNFASRTGSTTNPSLGKCTRTSTSAGVSSSSGLMTTSSGDRSTSQPIVGLSSFSSAHPHPQFQNVHLAYLLISSCIVRRNADLHSRHEPYFPVELEMRLRRRRQQERCPSRWSIVLQLLQCCFGTRDSGLRRGEGGEMLLHGSIPLEEGWVARGIENG